MERLTRFVCSLDSVRDVRHFTKLSGTRSLL